MWADDTVQEHQGDYVMNQSERAEVVGGCRYVDEVLKDTPFQPDLPYLHKHDVRNIT